LDKLRLAAQHSVHLTGGILRHFRAFSTLEQNPALEVLSTPAHPQVTQTVGRIIEGWNLVAGEGGIVYGEFKKQNDGIAD
jgi:hypothetical protein